MCLKCEHKALMVILSPVESKQGYSDCEPDGLDLCLGWCFLIVIWTTSFTSPCFCLHFHIRWHISYLVSYKKLSLNLVVSNNKLLLFYVFSRRQDF